jgi:hypothetical protein
MRIVGSWTLSQVSCTIIIKVLFVGWSPKNCARKAILLRGVQLNRLELIVLGRRLHSSQRWIRWYFARWFLFGCEKTTWISLKEIFFLGFGVKSALWCTQRCSRSQALHWGWPERAGRAEGCFALGLPHRGLQLGSLLISHWALWWGWNFSYISRVGDWVNHCHVCVLPYFLLLLISLIDLALSLPKN